LLAAVFASRMGRQVAIMVASAASETELSKSFRNHFILMRREEGRAIINRAIAQGEIRRNISVDIALDMIYGPVFYRLLMGHGPLDGKFTDAVVDQALQGISHKWSRGEVEPCTVMGLHPQTRARGCGRSCQPCRSSHPKRTRSAAASTRALLAAPLQMFPGIKMTATRRQPRGGGRLLFFREVPTAALYGDL